MSLVRNICETRLKKNFILFLIILVLSVAFHFRGEFVLFSFFQQLLQDNLLYSVAVVAVVFSLLIWGGWYVLGSTQRIAWVGICFISVFVYIQGILMHVFYNNQTGMNALPESIGNSMFYFLLLYFVWNLPPSRLEFQARSGLIVSGTVLVIFCLYQLFRVQGVGNNSPLVPIDAYGVYSDAFRLGGTSGSPTLTAAVLTLCWPAFFGVSFCAAIFWNAVTHLGRHLIVPMGDFADLYPCRLFRIDASMDFVGCGSYSCASATHSFVDQARAACFDTSILCDVDFDSFDCSSICVSDTAYRCVCR